MPQTVNPELRESAPSANAAGRDSRPPSGPSPDKLIGASRAIQQVREQIEVAGRSRFSLFVTGEEGIDKDWIGRIVHHSSGWASGSYRSLNASAMSGRLLARELFGTEAGAITSLPEASLGALAQAGAGTVLLDHIEAVPRPLQTLLARALERKRFTPIGSRKELTLHCRLIGASPHTLERLTSVGRLLPELAQHLQLIEIHIPPLRERCEDVLPLALSALFRAREEFERERGVACPVERFSLLALERLCGYHWPGNEHELNDQVRSALRLARRAELGPEDLLLGSDTIERIPTFQEAKRSFEREYAMRVLRLCSGNVSRAARLAGKDRKDFYDVMRRNGIEPQDFRASRAQRRRDARRMRAAARFPASTPG